MVRGTRIRANRCVQRIPRQLTDMVYMINHRRQFHMLRQRFAMYPIGCEHPRIEGSTNHRTTRNESLDLFIGKLSITGNQCATVIVAGNHRTIETIKCFVETHIGQMRQVKDHPNPFKLLEQFNPLRRQGSANTGASCIMAEPKMRQHNTTQPVLPPRLRLRRFDNRIGTLHG